MVNVGDLVPSQSSPGVWVIDVVTEVIQQTDAPLAIALGTSEALVVSQQLGDMEFSSKRDAENAISEAITAMIVESL